VYVASALIALLCDSRAAVSSLRVSVGFVYRFDGRIDLSKAFVDAIVDVDFVDMSSFSEFGFMLVRYEVGIAENGWQLYKRTIT
jgi:hypothetical protein